MTSLDKNPPVALSIAGSDSGGGAGIQADLKAMAHRGVHGCTAITAVTAQNSTGVQGIEPLSPSFVKKQIESVADDFDLKATKTGMLFNEGIIEAVAETRERLGKLVVDPVMVAASGDPLLEETAEKSLVKKLIPRADLVTPNWPEAKRLSKVAGIDVKDHKEPGELANELAGAIDGPDVLIKAGHIDETDAVDYMATPQGDLRKFSSDRIPTSNTHGAGCSFSSLITAELANNNHLQEAVETAKKETTHALQESYAPGDGPGTLNFLRD